ncbi:CapA family protein [Brevibacillus borstelensis]|uniref:CapA family protein n=1 Tax=Brevibacillus borstelensis TaxID=45462 RepID=UPI0030BBA548
MRKKWCSLVIAVAIGWGTVGCVPQTGKTDQNTAAPVSSAAAKEPADISAVPAAGETDVSSGETGADDEAEQPRPLSRFPEQRITLMAIGDIMVHDEQLEAALSPDKKTYDFGPSFAYVKPIFQEADWLIGNLETTLAGQELRYSGYPMFNSPDSLADTLKELGFTALTTANNHSMDRKEKGVLRTIEQLDRVGLLHTGTFGDEASRGEPLFLKKDGFMMALLSYTYGTNGIPIPKEKPYLVNLINPDLIKADIAKARAAGADLVAVALHFGNEYQRMPDARQRETAELCVKYGADLILGAHPHVVQPYEWKTVTLEDGSTHTGFIAYSLGNFISAQRREYKDVGVILKLTLYKGETGEAKVEKAEWTTTYVHYYRKNGKRHYVIYPVPLAVTAAGRQGEQPPVLGKELVNYLNRLQKEMDTHLNSMNKQAKAS